MPQPVLDRIARQVRDARIGYAPSDDGDWRYGTDAAYLAELVAYWRDRYDWRTAEAALNRFAQYVVTIDGLRIHFYHVRGDGSRPFPILLTHGWPGSVVEFQAVIPLLASAGYDVVVPSLPGHGWSARPPAPIGPLAIARLWRNLMVDTLGYSRFVAQGGDWGWVITRQLALLAPESLAGIHLNFIMPPAVRAGSPDALIAYWEQVQAVRGIEKRLCRSTGDQTADHRPRAPRQPHRLGRLGRRQILPLGRHG